MVMLKTPPTNTRTDIKTSLGESVADGENKQINLNISNLNYNLSL